jgi:hypothetical protein
MATESGNIIPRLGWLRAAGCRLQGGLFASVDIASVAVFRILFGALMLVATLRFFAHGWIAEYFLTPKHFFPYFGLDWIRPWPGIGMYLHFAVMGACAAAVMVGWYYRVAIVLFGLLFSYAHLIDRTNYLNHYYLVMCLSGLMAFLPLNRWASLDTLRQPSLRSNWVPAWVLWALRGQIAVVYFFGGVAKLKSDWLIEAEPLRTWLMANTDFPVMGALFQYGVTAHVMSIAGAVFDLTIVPLLLWPRSRWFAYGAVVFFHLVTARLFQLGMFPWIMVASSLLFLPSDWPRRVMAVFDGRRNVGAIHESPLRLTMPSHSIVVMALSVYFAFQVLMPLRHWLYPGDVYWTEQGFRFSWNVMLMEKNGSADFHVTEPSTGKHWDVSSTQYLTRYQAKMMASQPDMIVDFAQLVARDFAQRGVRDPLVTVDAFASLNGRRMARLVDPTVDLAQQRDGLLPKSWILPSPRAPQALRPIASR